MIAKVNNMTGWAYMKLKYINVNMFWMVRVVKFLMIFHKLALNCYWRLSI